MWVFAVADTCRIWVGICVGAHEDGRIGAAYLVGRRRCTGRQPRTRWRASRCFALAVFTLWKKLVDHPLPVVVIVIGGQDPSDRVGVLLAGQNGIAARVGRAFRTRSRLRPGQRHAARLKTEVGALPAPLPLPLRLRRPAAQPQHSISVKRQGQAPGARRAARPAMPASRAAVRAKRRRGARTGAHGIGGEDDLTRASSAGAALCLSAGLGLCESQRPDRPVAPRPRGPAPRGRPGLGRVDGWAWACVGEKQEWARIVSKPCRSAATVDELPAGVYDAARRRGMAASGLHVAESACQTVFLQGRTREGRAWVTERCHGRNTSA